MREVSAAQSYSISIDIEGCTRRDTIEIAAVIIPEINLGHDTVLCPGEINHPKF